MRRTAGEHNQRPVVGFVRIQLRSFSFCRTPKNVHGNNSPKRNLWTHRNYRYHRDPDHNEAKSHGPFVTTVTFPHFLQQPTFCTACTIAFINKPCGGYSLSCAPPHQLPFHSRSIDESIVETILNLHRCNSHIRSNFASR